MAEAQPPPSGLVETKDCVSPESRRKFGLENKNVDVGNKYHRKSFNSQSQQNEVEEE
jgi:hypothetical protein